MSKFVRKRAIEVDIHQGSCHTTMFKPKYLSIETNATLMIRMDVLTYKSPYNKYTTIRGMEYSNRPRGKCIQIIFTHKPNK